MGLNPAIAGGDDGASDKAGATLGDGMMPMLTGQSQRFGCFGAALWRPDDRLTVNYPLQLVVGYAKALLA